MTHDELQQAASDHLLLHFSKQSIDDLLVLERGEGPYVFDTRGKRYIDALSSLFCAQIGYSYGEEMAAAAAGAADDAGVQHQLGHGAPGVDRARGQARERWRRPATWTASSSPAAARSRSRPRGSSCREHYLAIGQPQRTKAIARDIAYHGVTLGALSFTGVERFKEPFGRPAIDVTHVSNTNMFRGPDGGRRPTAAFCARLLAEVEDAILAAGPDEVALIIAEPVQNAGGCLVAPPGYWQGLRALADKYGALLMADEVICGCGRLGEWFAIGREGVTPDLVSLAKGLTSAYAPMGAVVVARVASSRRSSSRARSSATASPSAATRSPRRSR